MNIWIVFAVVAALLASQADAQTSASAPESPPSPALPTARWSDAVEVVIHAPRAITVHGACHVDLWKITRGDAAVWVLPTLLTAPRRMDWDTTCVKRALAGAKGLLLPGQYTGVPSSPNPLPDEKKLSDVVSPQTYARFKAAAWKIGLDPGYFEHERPGWAMRTFIPRVYSRMGLEIQSYPSDLPDLARDAHVPIVDVTFDNGTSADRNVRNDLDPTEDEACLNADLDRLDYTINRLPTVIDAWKKGDMPTLLANFSDETEPNCVPESVKNKRAGRSNIDIWTRAINRALDRGGTSVAAVPINWLLYKGGVLDAFAEDGATIVPPRGVMN